MHEAQVAVDPRVAGGYVEFDAVGQETGTGAIAGIVRDGAARPAGRHGEVASAALIEKVRSVVTDGQGKLQGAGAAAGTDSATVTLPRLQRR